MSLRQIIKNNKILNKLGIIDFLRLLRKKKTIWKHRGNNVECLICGTKFSEFSRPDKLFESDANTICWNCTSMSKHRLLWEYIHEKLNEVIEPKQKITILHFAPEPFFADIFSNSSNINYIACDLEPAIYNEICKTDTVIKMDITKIDLADNSVDFIFCNDVLEHIPDDYLAMSELCRVLKKSGKAFLRVPIDYTLDKTYEDDTITTEQGRFEAFGQGDHLRIYGKDFAERLRKINWEVIGDDYIKKYTPEELFRYGLEAGHLIYICTKN